MKVMFMLLYIDMMGIWEDGRFLVYISYMLGYVFKWVYILRYVEWFLFDFKWIVSNKD